MHRERWGSVLRAAGMVVVIGAAWTAPAAAQQAAPEPVRAESAHGRPDRAELERRFLARLSEVVQRELRTTPEQTRRLADVAQRFERERRPLLQREMTLRRELRRQLQAGDAADQRRVDAVTRELLQLQRRRLDIIEAEQRALAEFLTPVQRARYLALQENLRDRVEQRRGRTIRGRGGPPGGPPPG